MNSTRIILASSLALAASACLQPEEHAPHAGADEEPTELIESELAGVEDFRLVGVAPRPRAETGHAPRYELLLESARTGEERALGIEAIDAAIDRETQTLAWIDPMGTLYTAPLSEAPNQRREVASEVILGLAADGGRLAFAIRVNGPETSPFVYDLRTEALSALDGGEGPDEIVGFSPDCDSVLLLSGRTGLASLFDASVEGRTAMQLTNVGLSPGPNLDPTAVIPSPSNLRDVSWDRNGIAYRATDSTIWIKPDGQVQRLDRDDPIEELVR
jgi:hypothetical protein